MGNTTMALLHDPATRTSLEGRLGKLQPSTRASWGRMSAGQMLWHVNQALGVTIGETEADPARPPIPRPVMRFLVLNMPWVKNAPTNKAFVARDEHDFGAELARCRRIIATFTARPLDGPPLQHPMFGTMTVKDQSRLHAKHLDHHLKQFGV
jgi:hypothetical protein